MNEHSYRVYFAGDLFTHKALAGNLLLARQIHSLSHGKWDPVLPQNDEPTGERDHAAIRNHDLELLFECDCILANFDGTDLDSGTVVEFCYAKMLDIPAVLLRTDFRKGGDNDGVCDPMPWNLMCTHYPRTCNVLIHGMEVYQRTFRSEPQTDDFQSILLAYEQNIAHRVIDGLESVVAQKSWAEPQVASLQMLYANVVKSIGSGFESLMTADRIAVLIERKIRKRIYHA